MIFTNDPVVQWSKPDLHGTVLTAKILSIYQKSKLFGDHRRDGNAAKFASERTLLMDALLERKT